MAIETEEQIAQTSSNMPTIRLPESANALEPDARRRLLQFMLNERATSTQDAQRALQASAQSQEISTITGKPPVSPKQQFEESRNLAAGVVRYGLPALASGGQSLPTGAAFSAVSELTARQIERIGQDVDLNDYLEDLKAGGIAGAFDLALGGIQKSTAKLLVWTGKKFLLPREVPEELLTPEHKALETAQNVLSEASSDVDVLAQRNKFLTRWQRWMGKGKRPFSLTFGQYTAEERKWSAFLEGIARSGRTGQALMKQADEGNRRAVLTLWKKYLDARTSQMTDIELGKFFTSIIGTDINKVEKIGTAFEPVKAYRKYLWANFEEGLSQVGSDVTIDGTKLYRWLQDQKQPKALEIYRNAYNKKLLPSMDTAPSGASYKTPLPLPVTYQKVLKKAGFTTPKQSNITVEAEIIEAWRNLTPKQVNGLIREMNAAWTSHGENAYVNNEIIKNMRALIEPEFDAVVNSIPQLSDIRKAANNYQAITSEIYQGEIISAIRNKLTEKASTIAAYVGSFDSDPGLAYSRLMRLKEALFFSAATPQVKGNEITRLSRYKHFSAREAEVLELGGQGQRSIDIIWNERIIRPLRYRFINESVDASGRFNSGQLLERLYATEKNTPELTQLLFGAPEHISRMKDLLTTMDILSKSNGEQSIWFKLKESSEFAKLLMTPARLAFSGIAAGAGVATYTGASPILGAAGGAAIVTISPYVLAQIFSNPQLVRNLQAGLLAGPRSTQFAVALRKIGAMSAADSMNDEYYTRLPSDPVPLKPTQYAPSSWQK